MNKQLLQELQDSYNNQMNEKNTSEKTLEVLLKRKEIMENSPIVKDYIEILGQIDKVKESIHDEQQILDGIIRTVEYRNDIDTNKIYCYVGTFINEAQRPRLVERNCHLGEFDRYIDIESLFFIDNPIEDREVFESSNAIVVGEDLYEVHDNFIKDSIKVGQDVAIKKVLARTIKND